MIGYTAFCYGYDVKILLMLLIIHILLINNRTIDKNRLTINKVIKYFHLHFPNSDLNLEFIA